jgi:hypothetical protein
MTDFWASQDRLAEAIEQHPLTELLSYTVAPPASAAMIREREETFGTPLPRALAEFYGKHNGSTLRWRFKEALEPAERQRVLDAFTPLTPAPDYVFDIAGAINIVPVEHFLLLEDYTVPQIELSNPESPHHQFAFNGATYSHNEFVAMLHVFDATWADGAMAFVAQPGVDDWKMLWLKDEWIDFEGSRPTLLDDYLRLAIATWGLITARENIFAQHQGYLEPPVIFDQKYAAAQVPDILAESK